MKCEMIARAKVNQAKEDAERFVPPVRPPVSLSIYVTATGKTMHFTIPAHLLKTRQRRRGPKRRQRI